MKICGVSPRLLTLFVAEGETEEGLRSSKGPLSENQ